MEDWIEDDFWEPRDESFQECLSEVSFQLARECSGARVLDLFCRQGFFGLQCLRNGARHVTFVDKSPEVASDLQRTLEAIERDDQVCILRADAFLAPELSESSGRFDLVFLSPPRSYMHEPMLAKKVFTRVNDFLLSSAVHDGTVLVFSYTSLYSGPIPYRDYTQVNCRYKNMLFLRPENASRLCWKGGTGRLL